MGVLRLLLAATVWLTACASPAPAVGSSGPSSPTPSVRTDRVGNVLAPLVDDATWARLAAHRLRLPSLAAGAACPVTPAVPITTFVGPVAGPGTVYSIGNRIFYSRAPDGSLFTKVAWLSRPDYKDAALIRGARIDASGDVRFQAGGGPLTGELRFEYDTGTRSQGSEEGWRFLPSTVVIDGPGCYAFQVDGVDWSLTIVMDAAANP